MDPLSTQLGALSLGRTSPKPRTTPKRSSPIVVQLLSKTERNACYFHYSKARPFITTIASVPDVFVIGQLYRLQYDSDNKAVFNDLSTRVVERILKREDFAISGDRYAERTVPDLLLGCRNRDFEQSAATVVQLPSFGNRTLIISMPTVNGRIDDAIFRTTSGERFAVHVDNVKRSGDKKIMTLFCTPTTRLPSGLTKNSRLIQVDRDEERPPIVTAVLEDACMGPLPLPDFDLLLVRVYGRRGTFAHCPVTDRAPIQIRKNNGDVIMLNPQQSEAVYLYQDDADPALVVEAPPGSGKTMTAAAMAVGYKRHGVQLFLSTGNIAVFNMADALAELDHSGLKIVHLLSEEAAKKRHSPFGFQLLDGRDRARIAQLELELKYARGLEKREIIDQIREVKAEALARSGGCDVMFATVDKILSWLRKESKKPCPIQRQLEREVTRIVIDEASQMTEAALNAIHLSFPNAKLVLIGDSKQMPPFRYTKDEVASELCARSALDLMKRKNNIPVIRLRQVYRASQSLIAHYNHEFYGGTLVSGKPASNRDPLASIMKGTGGCLFVEVEMSKAERETGGTSLQNDAEIRALVWTINKLRQAGFDEDSVMVICFYEAQRRLAMDSIPDDYEVLTVDSAQGREKEIVVVLTTVDSPTASDFFKCPLRTNVAMSRHKDAIIVLGHAAVLGIEPWTRVLDKKYFTHAAFGSKNAV